MADTQKIIIVLLIVAIAFSVISIALTFSLNTLKPLSASPVKHIQRSSSGNVAIEVVPQPQEEQG